MTTGSRLEALVTGAALSFALIVVVQPSLVMLGVAALGVLVAMVATIILMAERAMTTKDCLVCLSSGACLSFGLMGAMQSNWVLMGVSAVCVLVVILAGLTEMSKHR